MPSGCCGSSYNAVTSALVSLSTVSVMDAGLPAWSTVSAVSVRSPSFRPLRSTSGTVQLPDASRVAWKVRSGFTPSLTVMSTSAPSCTNSKLPDRLVSGDSALFNTASAPVSAVMLMPVAKVSFRKVSVRVASLPAISVPVRVTVRLPSSRADRSALASVQLPSAAMVTVSVKVPPRLSSMRTSSVRPGSISVTVPDNSTPAATSAALTVSSPGCGTENAGLVISSLMIATGS